MKLIISCIVCLVPFLLDAQIISTFAGNGIRSITGLGGPATAATISSPAGGTFDKSGNFYFATTTPGDKILKVDRYGIITLVAGGVSGGFGGDGGQATAANLNRSNAVALDAKGNIYIADSYNNRVRKVDKATGIISTFAGNGGIGHTGDGGPATAAEVYDPIDICFDKSGNLYIAEAPHFVVRKVTPAGIISTVAGTPGVYGFSGDGGPATAAKLAEIWGLCMDADDNLYLADFANGRVRKVTPSGIISTVAGIGGPLVHGGDGGPATSAVVNPEKIVVDKYGNLFITSYISHRVRMVDKYGYITTICGNGTGGYSGDGLLASSAQLNYPSGLAVDSCNNIYIADLENNRIRKIIYPKCNYLETETLPRVSSQISIYPNPSNDILHIDNLQTTADYRLLSMVGAVLQQGGLKEGNNTINIAELPVGMYLVEVSNAAVGLSIMYKIVKQ